MHLFLTGEIQVGKSTLIRKVLTGAPGLRIGGFKTITVADVPDAVGSVYLIPAGLDGTEGLLVPSAQNRHAGKHAADQGSAGSWGSIDPELLRPEIRKELNRSCRAGIRFGTGRGAESFPEVFETRGLEILRDAEKCDLIIMDEVGRMEGSAESFRRRIMEILQGAVPVLGVVQKRGETELQQFIRGSAGVRILTVNEQNRDALKDILAAWLKDAAAYGSDSG